MTFADGDDLDWEFALVSRIGHPTAISGRVRWRQSEKREFKTCGCCIPMRLESIRHTYATMMLMAGEHVGRQADGTHRLVLDGQTLFTVDHIRYAGRWPESGEALVTTWSQRVGN